MSCHFLLIAQKRTLVSTLEISIILAPRQGSVIKQKIMVFMRSITTLKLSTLIGINPGTSRSKVCGFIIQIYDFCGINIGF